MKPLALSLSLPLAFTACGGSGERNPDPGQTLLEVLDERSDLSSLRSLVETAGIETELSDPDARVMLFAPSNEAIAALPSDVTAYLTNNPAVLAEVLRYHVVAERRGLTGLNPIDDEDLTTMEGESITVVGGPPRTIEIQDATGMSFSIVAGDIPAGLSVIHIIDGVMLPREIEPQPPLEDLAGAVMDDGRFAVLVDAASTLRVGGRPLAQILRDPEAQTLFAPTDDAFGDLGVELADLSNDTDLGDVVTNLLLAHVASGRWSAERLQSEGEVPTRARIALPYEPASTGPATIGGAAVTETDVEASNGLLHVLDEVIVPPQLLQVATSTPGLGTFASTVDTEASPQTGNDLAPAVFEGDRPITVFAPDDEAFAVADLEGEDLDAVLRYHVLPGQLTADDLAATPDGTELDTLGGDVLTVVNDGTAVRLRDGRGSEVEILDFDIRALNGVLHVVANVLLPAAMPPLDVVETATDLSEDPANGIELGTLLRAASTLEIEGTPIANVLSEPGPWTLFAPTDTAFVGLQLDLTDLETDEALQDVVTNILSTHVVSGRVDSLALSVDPRVENLAGTTLDFDDSATPPLIERAAISELDIDASNGLLHLLDDVIVPPTLLEVSTETSTLTAWVAAVEGASAAVQAALDPNVFAGEAPITVFAPSDAAFAAADLGGEDVDDVLAYHALAGQVSASELEALGDGSTLLTLEGSELTVRTDGELLELEDGRGRRIAVQDPDVRTLNGILHGVDAVLLPPVAP